MQNATLPTGTETEHHASSIVTSSRERLEILASELAQTIKLSRRTVRGNPVQTRLRKLDSFIRSAYKYFEEFGKDQVTISHATEWVLDNFYVIEQAIRQVREGMPADYYRRLLMLR